MPNPLNRAVGIETDPRWGTISPEAQAFLDAQQQEYQRQYLTGTNPLAPWQGAAGQRRAAEIAGPAALMAFVPGMATGALAGMGGGYLGRGTAEALGASPETSELVGQLAEVATPGPDISQAAFLFGAPATRKAVAEGLQAIRKGSKVGSPLRRGIIKKAKEGVLLSEEIPTSAKEWAKTTVSPGMEPTGRLGPVFGKTGKYEGRPLSRRMQELVIAPGSSASPDTAVHELAHLGQRGVYPEISEPGLQEGVASGWTHPRAAYAKTDAGRLDESLAYTLEDLLAGRTTLEEIPVELRDPLARYLGLRNVP